MTVSNFSPEMEALRLMTLFDDLMQMLDAERNALTKRNLTHLNAIIPEKEKKSQELIRALQFFLQGNRGDKTLPENIRQKLLEKKALFDQAAQENLQHLQRMQNTIHRVRDRMMTAAREALSQQALQYSKKGHLNKGYKPRAASIMETA